VRTGLLVSAALAVALLLAGATYGGDYVPPPGDGYPVWSPDATRIAYLTERDGIGLVVVSTDGSDTQRLLNSFGPPLGYAAPNAVALSPDWKWAAVIHFDAGAFNLSLVRLDGSEERSLGRVGFGTRPAWSPDSRRLAFGSNTGSLGDGSLNVTSLDGGGVASVARGGTAPSWSPDGTRIAYQAVVPGGTDIRVVGADGSGDMLAAGGPGAQLEPKWSPDGANIAFITAPSADFGVVRSDRSGLRTFPGPGVTNSDAFAWAPDGRSIIYARGVTQGLFRLDIATGETRRLTAFGGMPAVSPNGARLAFAGGGECRDREGIYVAAATGGQISRITNDCRIVGTARNDVLRGTDLADVLDGLAGNDRLVAVSGSFGDTLLGGDGNDVLTGSELGDVLRGGRGADRLLGGNSQDDLDGGSGRDRIDGGRGDDLVHARDGWRDTVTCGTSRARREQDEAWVDRFDAVARDCEVVHRSR